jgi:hypothetical protein
MVVALASFLLVGCLGNGIIDDGDGDGDVAGEVTVDIAGAVVVDGKTYVSGGAHTITVTFPAPVVGGVAAWISGCGGDYRQPSDIDVVLFPNADRTIWTGSGEFGYGSGCCASYVEVSSGECDPDVCIWFPVIVDSCDPFAEIEIDVEDCECKGCTITFETVTDPGGCADDIVCCDDECSGLASWSVVLYDGDPFDVCCDPNVCEEPIGSCSGTACPISCETDCLTGGTPGTTYYAVITLVDNVGNETVYYAMIVLSGDGLTDDCAILVYEGTAADAPECVDWPSVTTDTIGECSD